MRRTKARSVPARPAALLLVAILALGVLPLAAPSARAAGQTFTVTSAADPGSGGCTASECTLREAITAANATPGADAIAFNIAGGGVRTIRPTSPLPPITDPVTIDGYTQPGASPNTEEVGTNAQLVVELDGTNAGQAVPGLLVQTSEVVVRGLVINRFRLDGIAVRGSRNRIEGNSIGTDPAGTVALGNEIRGLSVIGDANVVGGTTAAARNVISGNGILGIDMVGNRNRVQGNLIGTQRDGIAPLGNGGEGIIAGGSTSVIAFNTIASNGGNAVSILGSGTGHRILGNAIFGNRGIGIDLGRDGRTRNDAGDADVGPNNLQNTPVLIAAFTAGGATTVRGTLASTPDTAFTLQFFANPSGNEGKTFIGQRRVVTDARGDAAITFRPAPAAPRGQAITATATDPDGNTSEFSAPEVVESAR